MPHSFCAPGIHGPGFNIVRTRLFSSALGITGQTIDSVGNILGFCVVNLFLTASNLFVGTTTSDSSGNFTFNVPNDISTYYMVAYKAGSPDVEGTTVNTLVGAQPANPSGGGSIFDPGTLNLSGWYKAYGGVPNLPTASAGNSGGNGNLITGPAPDTAPTVGTAVDGFTTANYNGASNSLKSALAPSNFITIGALTAIILFKATALQANSANWFDNPGLVTDDGGANWGITLSSTGLHFAVFAADINNYRIDPGVVSTGAWMMAAMRFNNVQLDARVNNTDSASVPVGFNLDQIGVNFMEFGRIDPTPNPSNWANVITMEIMLSKVRLTDTNITNVYSYFKATYPSMLLP